MIHRFYSHQMANFMTEQNVYGFQIKIHNVGFIFHKN